MILRSLAGARVEAGLSPSGHVLCTKTSVHKRTTREKLDHPTIAIKAIILPPRRRLSSSNFSTKHCDSRPWRKVKPRHAKTRPAYNSRKQHDTAHHTDTAAQQLGPTAHSPQPTNPQHRPLLKEGRKAYATRAETGSQREAHNPLLHWQTTHVGKKQARGHKIFRPLHGGPPQPVLTRTPLSFSNASSQRSRAGG